MNTVSPDLSDRLQFAVDIARQAGEVTLKYFQQDNYEVDLKADNSPVTIADQQAEQLLRNEITARFPEDGIIGEEYGKTEGSNDYCWVLDPIDGTKSFISGVPLYGTLVGVLHQEQGMVGVIFMPGLNEMIYAGQGQGAWYQRGTSQPQPAVPSPTPSANPHTA